MAGHRRAEATPSFGRLCPAMTDRAAFSKHPTLRSLKLLGFLPRMFRRGRGDETILRHMKPFSSLRADVPKRSLTINLPNDAPPSGDYWEPVMQNVVAINSAAREGIIAAQATSDEMLLERIAEGGRTAMHTLYSRHNVRVYRFVLRIVRDTTMAEDLVSQVFLDVWRTASQFEGRSQVSTWLLSIARFKALTAMRQRRHEDIDQEDVLEIADQADTPEASLNRSNTSEILRACVAKLSPAHREIINLVYYHEKSVEEAGAIIGIPQSTVKTRMFYARKQLADLLKGAGVEGLAA
jgi:RNA polymerase sigma-70 factor (ECF subfamily)